MRHIKCCKAETLGFRIAPRLVFTGFFFLSSHVTLDHKINIVLINGESEESFRVSIVEAKDSLERRRQSLIRMAITTSSTLIGLVAVFGDMKSSNMILRILIVCGVLSLSLTVVCGLIASYQILQSERELLVKILRLRSEGTLSSVVDRPSPKLCEFFAKSVPWLMCSGVLFLAAGIVLTALSPG